MHAFANPARFLKIARPLTPILGWLGAAFILGGAYAGLFTTPPDYLQGETVRIMYIHVPAAWLGMAGWSGIAIASIVQLVWRHPLAGVAARAIAVPGALFTALCLATGSLWGRPAWGTWWEWDARLTSVLILFFMYIGYIALSDSYSTQERGKKICAIMALVGFVNIPIIRFSVEWWSTLHQPASIIRSGGVAIDNTMLIPLFSMGIAFMLIYFTLLLIRMKTALINQKIRRLQFNG